MDRGNAEGRDTGQPATLGKPSLGDDGKIEPSVPIIEFFTEPFVLSYGLKLQNQFRNRCVSPVV